MGITNTTRPTITEELIGTGVPKYSHPDPQAYAEGLRDYALNTKAPIQPATQMDKFIGDMSELAGDYYSQGEELDRVLFHLRGKVPEKKDNRVVDPHPEPESVLGRLHALLDDIRSSRDKVYAAISELREIL